jgi:hypothetical protein
MLRTGLSKPRHHPATGPTSSAPTGRYLP